MLPLDENVIRFVKSARSFLRFTKHDCKDSGVEGALIDGNFRGTGDGGDKARLNFDDAHGADFVDTGLRMAEGDFATLECRGRRGEKGVPAQGDGRGSGMRGLTDKADHVALESKGPEHDTRGLVHGLQDAALLDVELEVSLGVDALELLVGVGHRFEGDAVLAKGI